MKFELPSEQLQTQPCLAQCSFSIRDHIYRLRMGNILDIQGCVHHMYWNATFQALHGHIIQPTAMAVTASILDKRSNLTAPDAWHPHTPAVALETLRTMNIC